MTAQILDLTAEQGGTYGQLIICDDASGLINFTGFTARMQVRDGYAGATAIFDLSTGNGLTLGGTAGTIFISISSSALRAIELPPNPAQTGKPSKAFVYDLEVSNAGIDTPLLEGTFTITGRVTR